MRLCLIAVATCTLVLAAVGVLPVAGAAAQPRPLALSGQLHVTQRTIKTIPDVGSADALSGSGALSIGPTTVSGSLQGTGFIASGYCSGRLGLRTTRGTLLLSLRSPSPVRGFTSCSDYSWHVVGASGSYRGRLGSGSLSIATSGRGFTLSFG